MRGIRQAGHQGLGIGMRRLFEHLGDRRRLDNAARIHDCNPIDELGHDTEVMRDEQDRQPHGVAELAKQAEDLRLHRDIECGGRLIRNQHLRPAGQRDGDHDPLAHSAGQLMRIGAELQRRVRNPDQFEQFPRPSCQRVAGKLFVNPDRFLDLLADFHDRVQ